MALSICLAAMFYLQDAKSVRLNNLKANAVVANAEAKIA
jgi:hypothetical protein